MSERERREAARAAALGDREGLARLRRIVARTGELDAFEDGVDDVHCKGLARADVVTTLERARRATTGWAVHTQDGWGTHLLVVRAALDVFEVWACYVKPDAELPAGEDPAALVAAASAHDPRTVHVRAAADVILTWLEEQPAGADPQWLHARVRPAMYFGSVTSLGANAVVDEALERAVREFSGGHATRIDVEIEPNGRVTVIDDGSGVLRVPGPSSSSGDQSHLFGDFAVPTDGSYLSDGMLAVACAVCDPLEITLERGGRTRRRTFRRGRAVGPTEEVEPSGRSGARISMRVDPRIFGEGRPDEQALAGRLALLAHLLPGLRTALRASPSTEAIETFAPDGLPALVGATRTTGLLPRVATGSVGGPIEVDERSRSVGAAAVVGSA